MDTSCIFELFIILMCWFAELYLRIFQSLRNSLYEKVKISNEKVILSPTYCWVTLICYKSFKCIVYWTTLNWVIYLSRLRLLQRVKEVKSFIESGNISGCWTKNIVHDYVQIVPGSWIAERRLIQLRTILYLNITEYILVYSLTYSGQTRQHSKHQDM